MFCRFVLLASFVVVSLGRNLASPNITEVITGYGYPVEVHTVLTDDNYLLTMHRIPHGKVNAPPTKGVVLLQHGVSDSSAGWCLNPPSMALPYILADSGYDVWLGNNRGNGYSMNNTQYSPSDAEFWDFSWQEMAEYDFPAFISYALNKSGASKISYVGHSEGTIQAFAGLIEKPEIAQKLNIYIAVAPVAYVGNLSVSLLRTLAKLDFPEILKLLGSKEFILSDAIHNLLPGLCKLDPRICTYGSSLFYGKNTYINQSFFPLIADYEPFPTSTKNLIHWSQGVRSNTFSKFDYGTTKNLKVYGQSTPPPYDLSAYPSTLPTVLFTGGLDGLATPLDVQHLLSEISVKPTVFTRDDYGHVDPLLGDMAAVYTYPFVLEQLEKYC